MKAPSQEQEISARLPDPRLVATVARIGKPAVSFSQTVSRVAVDAARGVVRLLMAPGGPVRTVLVIARPGRPPDIAVEMPEEQFPGLALQNATIEGEPLVRFAFGCLARVAA